MGVNGNPLKVIGSTEVNITAADLSLCVRVRVVDSLMAEGIWVWTFLRSIPVSWIYLMNYCSSLNGALAFE